MSGRHCCILPFPPSPQLRGVQSSHLAILLLLEALLVLLALLDDLAARGDVLQPLVERAARQPGDSFSHVRAHGFSGKVGRKDGRDEGLQASGQLRQLPAGLDGLEAVIAEVEAACERKQK